jgi:hypothetical protein
MEAIILPTASERGYSIAFFPKATPAALKRSAHPGVNTPHDDQAFSRQISDPIFQHP